MNDNEADDERSSFDDDEILFLMDKIALHSIKNDLNIGENVKFETFRRKRINNAERNLLNKNNIYISPNIHYSHTNNVPFERWKKAFHKISNLKDPWKNFDILGITAERVERHQFDATHDTWRKPIECFVKIEGNPFNRGAMRECFRLKKMSSLFKQDCNWKHAGNYVAKRYLENVESSVYYEDVKLQMDAKLWGQEYSRQAGLVKKVDICQMSLIKFIDRPNQPIYHLEHFIEGKYIKYNSNSGFVDENSRNTPQAFSHFTFERSGHKVIVVDIQGVGDLYTDPQIHTFSRSGYGDGNLGPRGMALFFYSHTCNFICKILGLEEFDLSQTEKLTKDLVLSGLINVGTVAVEGAKVKSLYVEQENCKLNNILKHRIKQTSMDESGLEYGQSTDSGSIRYIGEDGDDEASESIDVISNKSNDLRSLKCIRSQVASSEIHGNEEFFNLSMERKPSCAWLINTSLNSTKVGECILDEIHHEMARLHNSGKLIDCDITNEVNWEAFMFHEELAAKLGCLEAIKNLACFYLNLMSDSLFENYPFKAKETDCDKGLKYMQKAAEAGDRRSMIFLGDYLRKEGATPNWREAYSWYEKAVSSACLLDDSGCFDSTNYTPLYEIMFRMANMLAEGGYNLEKDLDKAYELYTQAAEEATHAGKGKLASKYYELSERISCDIRSI